MPCSNQDTIYENSNKDNNKDYLSERWSITRWPGTARVGDGNSNVFTQQALHYLPNKSTPGWVAFLQSPSTYVQLFLSLTDYRIPRIPRRLWFVPPVMLLPPPGVQWRLLSCSSSRSSWTNLKLWFASTAIIWILKMVCGCFGNANFFPRGSSVGQRSLSSLFVQEVTAMNTDPVFIGRGLEWREAQRNWKDLWYDSFGEGYQFPQDSTNQNPFAENAIAF